MKTLILAALVSLISWQALATCNNRNGAALAAKEQHSTLLPGQAQVAAKAPVQVKPVRGASGTH